MNPHVEQVGSYRLVRRIGSGGMAEVWLGQHVVSGGLGAVKRLSARAATRGLMAEFFAREGRAIARLSHPHVVPLFEYGDQHVVTAFIDGTSLARRMTSPIDPVNAVRIARQIAAALTHAHQRGVIHRDVKPSNILLDRNGTAYLADFGVAAFGDDHLDAVVGTPRFMAPEQRDGDRVGPAADQYGLARTLLDVLAYGAPELGAGLPAPLRAVLMRATAADPCARFPSIEAFAEALKVLDLSTHQPAVHLATPLRLERRYAWVGGADRREAVGTDIVRNDYRLSELVARGLIEPARAQALLAESGLADIGFSSWMATPRLGDPADPASLARVREVVVLLHGWAGTRHSWRLIAQALCRDNALAVVIAPDVHGFGESRFAAPPDRERGALAAIARAAVGLSTILGLAGIPTVLVGHSMAGMGLLALDDRDFAPRTSRVAINPIFMSRNAKLRRDMGRFARMSRALGWLGPLRRAALRFGARTGPFADVSADEKGRALAQALALPWRVETRILEAFTQVPFRIGRQQRVTMVINVDDPWMPQGEKLDQVIAELGLERAQLHRMASGGHAPHLESASHPEWTRRNHDELVRVIQGMIITAHEPSIVTGPSGSDDTTAATM